jgi:3-hydroxy-9,10-secoandrosta-1,3,5(10)-triene-9,17-dione monooxygenase
LIERQGETEALTRYPASTHDDFTRAGFYQLLVPRRFGGLEVDLSTFWRVLVAIARGCPSTAWCYGVAAGTALQVGAWFEEQTQAEVFGDGHFISPTVAPPAGVAARERSGWILNGTHRYASGAPYATHFVGQTFADAVDTDGRRSLLLFVAPRSSWTMLDDWGDLLGLKGSGSNSVHFADAYIPSRYVLENVSMVDVDLGDTGPGWRLHGNPMYAVRTAFVFQSEIAAIMIGAAKGALDEYESIIKARTTQRPPIVARYLDPDYQRWFGIALGKIATAEAALLQASEQYLQSCREAAQQGVGLSAAGDGPGVGRHAELPLQDGRVERGRERRPDRADLSRYVHWLEPFPEPRGRLGCERTRARTFRIDARPMMSSKESAHKIAEDAPWAPSSHIREARHSRLVASRTKQSEHALLGARN